MSDNSKKITVLSIHHKHGVNKSAHKSNSSAMKALYDYCVDEWDDGLDDQYGKLTDLTQDDAIDAYFDAWGSALDPEWYEFDNMELQD